VTPRMRQRAALRERAFAMLDSGRTFADTERETGVPTRTLMRWRAAQRAELAEAATPSAPAATAHAELGDTRGTASAIVEEAHRAAEEARAVGNHAAASRFLKIAQDSNRTRLASEKVHRADADALVMSRSEIDAAMKAVTDRFAVLERVPLYCRKCGAAMRVLLASDGEATS
jgi:hypothetical protein